MRLTELFTLFIAAHASLPITFNQGQNEIRVTFQNDIDSWIVLLPNMFQGDIVVPSFPTIDNVNSIPYTQYTAQMSCDELTTILRDPQFISPHAVTETPHDTCEQSVNDIHNAGSLIHDLFGNPYGDNSLYSRGSDGIVIKRTSPYIEARLKNGTTDLLLRVIIINSLQTTFVIHQKQAMIHLQRDISLGGGTISLQHECSRRGFAAPNFATLDLSSFDNIEYCVIICREGLLRTPWAAAPPSRKSVTSMQTNTSQACRPLPESFNAALIELEFSTALRTTVGSQVPDAVYDEVNDIARAMEDAAADHNILDAMVAMTVLNAKYTDMRFSTLINEVSALHENKHLVLRLDQKSPTEYVPHRRLLTSHSIITVTGVVFTTNIRMQPGRLEEQLKSGFRRITEERQITDFLQVLTYIGVTSLHHSTTPPQTAQDNSIRNWILLCASVLFVVIAGISIYFVKKIDKKNKRSDLRQPFMESSW